MASLPSGVLLGTSPRMLKDIQDSNMLEFAQRAGVLPDFETGVLDEQPECDVPRHDGLRQWLDGRVSSSDQAQPMDTSDEPGPLPPQQKQQQLQKEQQFRSQQAQQHSQQEQPQQQQLDGSSNQNHQQQQQLQQRHDPLEAPVNAAAEAAVMTAERVLAQARSTVAALSGYDQAASSRSTSYGPGPGPSEDAAGSGAGPTIGVVRRAARRGARGADQAHNSAAASYGSGGYGGGGYGGGGYGGGGYGGGGYGGGYGVQAVGPLGFAPSERTGGKQGKGLRHFSMKVCEKVESKGTTTYNEVADELVAEMKDSQMEDGVVYDEKNIRRRVYDAINVLMALDVIAKDKKAIIWRGFHADATGVVMSAAAAAAGAGAAGPQRHTASAAAVSRAQAARAEAADAVARKAAHLAELLEDQAGLRGLIARNAAAAQAGGAGGTQLELPFILVQASPDATVEVQISDDMRDVQFDFTQSPFKLHDESHVLRMLAEESRRRSLLGEAVAAAATAAAADAVAAAAGTVVPSAAVPPGGLAAVPPHGLAFTSPVRGGGGGGSFSGGGSAS